MFGTYFYNESMRRMTIGFGQIFNNIQIKRKDSSGNVVQSIRVPLAYAPKEKFLARLDQQASLNDREFSITLPRMSFEISGIQYDASRKLTRVQKYKTVKSGIDGKVLNYNYVPVPYNVSYNLYSFTASAEAGLQIIEQILPFFQPDYTLTVNDMADMGIKRDVPIVLNSISYEDNYQGDFETRRALIYTLDFTAKFYLYGPVTSSSVIKTVQIDHYADIKDNSPKREQRYTVSPKPASADADDDFGFNETTSFFQDAKEFDPVSGTDKI